MSQQEGRFGTWQKDVDPQAAGVDPTMVGAAAAATEPAKAGPVVEDKTDKVVLLQDVLTVRAVMTNLPAPDVRVTRGVAETLVATASQRVQDVRERHDGQATIDVALVQIAPIAMTARTVIAEMSQDQSAATAVSVRVMLPNEPLSSRFMTDRRFLTTLRPRTWTSMRCVVFMAWPTNLSTGLPVTW